MLLSNVVKWACYRTQSGNGKGVSYLSSLFSFIVSVMQNVIAHYICKWLDGDE